MGLDNREYEIMQVCESGHKITDMYQCDKLERRPTCPECGELTIHTCPSCGVPIRGRPISVDFEQYKSMAAKKKHSHLAPKVDVPPKCHKCERLFPWSQSEKKRFGEKFDTELLSRVVPLYDRGHYQSAVQTAFIILEERVRSLGDFPQNQHGDSLITDAFSPEDGPLSFGKTGGEQKGAQFLYRGAMMTFRNPVSHRFVRKIDKEYTRDVLHTVNLLLRSIDEKGEESSE